MFQSIFNDIFPEKWPSFSVSENSATSFICAVKDTCVANHIDCTEYFLVKIQQLHQLMQMSVGVILIGDAYSGKTTVYRMLANAFALLGERNELDDARPQYKGNENYGTNGDKNGILN